MLTAVVPVKSIDLAKSRLAAVLDPAGRRALAEQMLGHVLETLSQAGLPAICVASDDSQVLALAERFGARRLSGVGDADLNAAVTTAARVVQADGVTDLLLVMADLPYLAPDDIAALIEAARRSAVVIAEAKDGGTNALVLRPPCVLDFAFATHQPSARFHAEQARAAGLTPELIRRPGLARDIDTPADLATLAAEHSAYRIFRHVA